MFFPTKFLRESLSLVSILFKSHRYFKSAGFFSSENTVKSVEEGEHRGFYLNKNLGAHLLKLITSKLINGKVYFVELELIGLGYRVSIKKGRIRLGLGFSHVIFLLIPKNVFVIKRKYRILVYSLDRFSLGSFVALLLRFKKLNPYKLKGLKKKHLVYKLKPGKRSK